MLRKLKTVNAQTLILFSSAKSYVKMMIIAMGSLGWNNIANALFTQRLTVIQKRAVVKIGKKILETFIRPN